MRHKTSPAALRHFRQCLEAGNSVVDSAKRAKITRSTAFAFAKEIRAQATETKQRVKLPLSNRAAAEMKEEKPLAPMQADGSIGWTPPKPDTHNILAFDIGDDVLFKIPKSTKLEDVFASIAKAYHKLGLYGAK